MMNTIVLTLSNEMFSDFFLNKRAVAGLCMCVNECTHNSVDSSKLTLKVNESKWD